VGGTFLEVGGLAVRRIARWTGAAWESLGRGVGVGSKAPASDHVYTLLAADDGTGPALFAGGAFDVSPGRDSFVAKWGTTP
jgi:hypothetical protein